MNEYREAADAIEAQCLELLHHIRYLELRRTACEGMVRTWVGTLPLEQLLELNQRIAEIDVALPAARATLAEIERTAALQQTRALPGGPGRGQRSSPTRPRRPPLTRASGASRASSASWGRRSTRWRSARGTSSAQSAGSRAVRSSQIHSSDALSGLLPIGRCHCPPARREAARCPGCTTCGDKYGDMSGDTGGDKCSAREIISPGRCL